MASRPEISLYDPVQPPTCISCGRVIHPNEKAVSFYCPNCGVALIWRCRKCRVQITPYTCPNCGFTGP